MISAGFLQRMLDGCTRSPDRGHLWCIDDLARRVGLPHSSVRPTRALAGTLTGERLAEIDSEVGSALAAGELRAVGTTRIITSPTDHRMLG